MRSPFSHRVPVAREAGFMLSIDDVNVSSLSVCNPGSLDEPSEHACKIKMDAAHPQMKFDFIIKCLQKISHCKSKELMNIYDLYMLF